jgi:signal transduction histidine kinase
MLFSMLSIHVGKAMTEKILANGKIAFQAEGRLLQELGLRLVASPEVALVELIKNSYDADSPSCTVRLEGDEATLVVADEGHGMTFDEFSSKWMRIATSSKLAHEESPQYHRRLTGAKGIGRFAVRYLGDYLRLETIAYDKKERCKTRLTATFDWPRLDKVSELSKVEIPYEVTRVEPETKSGTTLRIEALRSSTEFASSRALRDDVLRMVSPIQGLETGPFSSPNGGTDGDPGFSVTLPGEQQTKDVDLAKTVLGNYWARLTIQLKGSNLEFTVTHSTGRTKSLKTRVKTSISHGLFADIRYFPRRKGVFSGKEVNGKRAWTWVRDNCGVAVVDHGFRIKPYGFRDDDWLNLDMDAAHNERDWRTGIARKHFPVPLAKRGDPGENPVLNLASNFQLVGAVFVRSKRTSSSDEETDLVPAMDREGLLGNDGLRQLRSFVRAGIEFLAHQDKAELERLAIAEAKQATITAREEIKKAISHIEASPTLVAGDKARIVAQYRHLADRVDEHEKISEQSRRSSLTMGLLGVVAGFMTHESKAAVHDLERAVSHVRTMAKKDPKLAEVADELSRRLRNFQGYLDYARLFVRNVREPKEQSLPAAGQVRHVLNSFKDFADNRGIKVVNEIASDVMTPPLPVTVYSGVLLNLYTNALKAVIAAKSSVKQPRIVFRGWNETKKHVVEVADNGVGIPEELRKRIWDPLYTTTSDVGNPLGSGMGLGLTLVKQVTTAFGGSVSIAPDPPPGFTTCFRVVFPK